jgi:hypothetical protein
MRKLKPNRKARFKAALALADLSVGEWVENAGITRQHLNATLREDRESNSLIAKVDAFIAEIEANVLVS